MTNHRHSVQIAVLAGDPIFNEVANDKRVRIMAFCASEPNDILNDIAFPHQSEIKVNGGEIKANLRGLKNKPGSTRPVDITSALRLRPPHFSNTVELTFALTTKAGDNAPIVSFQTPTFPHLHGAIPPSAPYFL
jgi:E3 SUMO-protein ligase PIAS1